MRKTGIVQILSLIIFLIFNQKLLAQYTVNGNATQIACNEYILTPDAFTQSGSVWNNNKINLTQSFEFNFDIYLGNTDDGADGMVFVLQPISTSVGTTGGGLGYENITPAVGVTIDTYQNTGNNDPAYDHIAIQLNGNINHSTASNIAGPVTALSGSNDIEDGVYHSLKIKWDAAAKSFSAYVDGILRVSVIKDFVTDVFAGDPLVYWGFTGSTGGKKNLQKFRTALNPAFSFGPAQKRCLNEPVTFYDSTISFTTIAKFYWDFGDGTPLDSINLNPTHTYLTAGNYTVNQKVIGADGCTATNTQTVLIGSKPVPGFKMDDNCVVSTINFNDTSSVVYGTINNWFWNFDNGNTSTLQNPASSYTTGGNKMVKLVVQSAEGCISDTLQKLIRIYERPVLDFTFSDSICLGTATNFFGKVITASDPVITWAWNYGDTTALGNTQNTIHQFLFPGNHTVILLANSNGSAGCMGLVTKNVFVVNKPTANFTSTNICENAAVTFFDSSFTTDGVAINQWKWNLGNGNFSNQKNPVTSFNNVGNYTVNLVVQNAKSCASDTVKKLITVNAKPIANFGFSTPLCNGFPVQFFDSSTNSGSILKWSWIYNNAEFSTLQNASRSFTAGMATVKLVTNGSTGCASDTVARTFIISASPDVTISFKDACKNTPVNFTATDNSGTVTQWKWFFGDGGTAVTKDAQHVYVANGIYKVKLLATAANGCYSDSLQKDIFIYGTNAFAGNDTIAAAGQPIQLNATGGLSYSWTPAVLLNNANISNPIANLTATQTFTLKAFTPEGCESNDDVTIKIYKGPDIYLPNAFTPNGDGLNDIFKSIPVGIKQFNYLKIFNRWGQQIFSTTNYNKGWDGMWQGQKQNNGVFIVIANGIDFKGNVVDKRGTIMLMR